MKLYVSAEEYERMAKRQRAIAMEIAEMLESGASLDEASRFFAAVAIREWAESQPTAQPRKRGQAPKFCHATAAMMYAYKLGNGVAPTLAADLVADELGVSRPAITEAIKVHADQVARRVERYSRK